MSDTGVTSEKEVKQKKVSWSTTPSFAKQSFIIGIILIAESVINLFTFFGFAKIWNTIPLTMMLSIAIIVGIIGTILGSLSIREKKTIFGILGIILSIIAVLWNAFSLFVLHCDAWFSVPY